MTIETLRISRMVARLDYYPGNLAVRVNWCDGDFCLLLVEELRVALRNGKVFHRRADEIDSLEVQEKVST
jgi:hypothetical protein